jgi:hypothetical protein
LHSAMMGVTLRHKTSSQASADGVPYVHLDRNPMGRAVIKANCAEWAFSPT